MKGCVRGSRVARPNWSLRLPRPLKIPTVMTLTTFADMRELVEGHLPAECRERETWQHVIKGLQRAARGGDINEAVMARDSLQLEQVPWPAAVSLHVMTLNVTEYPKYWRNRAQEAWAIASEMRDAHARAIMVGIAQGYEQMTKWVEECAREPR